MNSTALIRPVRRFLPALLGPAPIFLSAVLFLAAAPPSWAAPSQEQVQFFEKKIRPVLADKCYKCHSAEADKIKGGLSLDSRDGLLRGGDSGPAVVPGSVERSLLIDAIRYQDEDLAMPPKKEGGKLADAVIKDFEEWVRMGAPDPREKAAADGVAQGKSGDSSGKNWKDYEEAVKWWAWQLPVKQTPPVTKDTAWPKGAVDQFILAQLESKGLRPVADADPAALLRRLYFDLIGLPPRPQEVIDFVKDWKAGSQKAMEAKVDQLLASPQFGERWGRHWLDVARYAESSGKDVNVAFPHAWRYRDYVIAAFNADKPYDAFLREQVAGDLLPYKDDKEKAENVIATGFLALGPKSLNEQNPRQYALDLADEQIDTLSQSLLATTISCARCHDHKFDPIPQREYYAMAGIFLSTDTKYGTAAGIQNRHATDLIELPKGCGLPVMSKTLSPEERERKEKELADLKQERDSTVRAAIGLRQQNRDGAKPPEPPQGNQQLRTLFVITRIGQLEAELKSYDASGNSKLLAMGVEELPATRQMGRGVGDFIRRRLQARFSRPAEFSFITDSPVFIRGDVDKPGDRVGRGFVSVLSKGEVPAIKSGSGRLELAQWLTSEGNPLTARVMANRVWTWLFGRGIVASTDNFGTSGKLPDNQPLLDYLALRLRGDCAWSLKKLIREIVVSHAYQLGSGHDEKNFQADPDNALCWRVSRRRLDAECIRDAMLAVSSQLNLERPVGSVVAYYGDGLIGGPRLRGMNEEYVIDPASLRRSVYLPTPRDVLPEALALFDFADSSLVTGARDTTNVPAQALFLLNSEFAATQAEKFAEKLLAAYPSSGANAGAGDRLKERLQWAYGLCFSRWPTEAELKAAQDYFFKYPAKETRGDPVKTAWTGLCRALFASAEFRCLN